MMKVTKVTPRILTGGAGAPPIRTALQCSSRSLAANWEGVLSRGRGREHCLRAPQLSYLVLPTTLQSPFPDEETRHSEVMPCISRASRCCRLGKALFSVPFQPPPPAGSYRLTSDSPGPSAEFLCGLRQTVSPLWTSISPTVQ